MKNILKLNLLPLLFFAALAGAWFSLDAGQLLTDRAAMTALASGGTPFQNSCSLPPTCTLTASPSSLNGPGNTVLYWDSTNAVGGSLEGISLPDASGHVPVTGITQTSTYTATFWNSVGGSVQCSATVTIAPPPVPAPTCTLSASPSTLAGPGNTTLTWTSTNAVDGSIDHGIGTLSGPSGSGSTPVSQTTTYTATFVNSAGVSVHCSTTVTVTPPPPAPTCTLSASPSTLTGPGNTTLTWTSTNAVSGSIDHGIGALSGPNASGSTPVSQTTTYTATFLNSAGVSVHCSTTVTVTPPPQNGCIQILKETFDPAGHSLTPVAQFSFKLDGGATVQNDASGNAIFNNVTPGVHTVTEVPAGSSWNLLSVTPASGQVTVAAGPTCAGVVFKNQQVTPPPQNGCIRITKQTLDPSGNNLTPVAQFTFKLDGVATTQNDAAGNAVFTNVTPGAHQVTEVSAGSTWNLVSIIPVLGNVTVSPGSSCVNVAFKNQQVITTNPPTCTLTATPNSFGVGGGTTTLSWTTTYTTSGSIDNGIGAISSGNLPVGSVSPVSVTSSKTYTLTVTGPGGTATCQAPVTVTAPPGPSCALSISASTIAPGGSVRISWTSANVTAGSIDNNVGPAVPVSVGTSIDMFPSSSLTYTGTFTGPYGTTTCSIPVTVQTPGCTINCGGGGLDQPNVALFKKPNDQPLAFVSLSQIPYTGFEAGPALTMIFWLSVALLAAMTAYATVGQGGVRSLIAYVLGEVVGVPMQNIYAKREEETEDEFSGYPAFDANPAPTVAAVVPTAPIRSYTIGSSVPAPVAALPDIAAVIESRAHAAGVLMSPEAVAIAVGLSPNRTEALNTFGEILNEAVRTLPREDGWIMLTTDRLEHFSSGKHASVIASSSVHAAATLDESAASAFAGAIALGDRDSAFSIIRSLEHDGVSPTALMTATASVFDKLYRSRRDQRPAPDMALAEKASRLSDQQLADFVSVFTHSLDHVYASPFTGVKLALAQAFEVLA